LAGVSTRVTRQDVALSAGVSGATVSRVYNHPDLVDAETRERVRSAAEALGFVPDKHASALRRRSSGTLLFVEIEDEGYRWPGQKAYMSLYGEIVRAVLHAAQTTPFQLQLVSVAPADIPTLSRFDFAGILGFDVVEQRWADALAAFGRPVVCCHHGDHLTGVSTVTTDNRGGGVLQAGHLAGHSAVAYVTGLRDEVRSHRLRWEGFASAVEPRLVIDGGVGYAAGRQAAVRLAPLAASGEITAAACVNDLTALGLLDGLTARGISAPGVFAVVGYDNLLADGLLGHALPTIDAQLPEVYTRALALLTRNSGEVHDRVAPVLVTA
jgi:DNA-binding LacI/PurR family transcriptional regulator